MNKILFILLMFLPFLTKGQSNPFPVDENGEIKTSEVVSSELKQKQLFANAQEWIAKTFGDYKRVLQFEDENNGKIVIKGLSPVEYSISSEILGIKITNSENVRFTLTIECKDNKYRYTIDNVSIMLNLSGEERNVSFFERFDSIEKDKREKQKIKNELDSLNRIDLAKLKKKEQRNIEYEISKLESRLDKNSTTDLKFIDSEIKAINVIIYSLKKSMQKEDDF